MINRLHREMILALGRAFGTEEGWRDEAEIAVYWFACHNHPGQWSDLYAISCASHYRPGPFLTWKSIDKECGLASMMYEILEEKMENYTVIGIYASFGETTGDNVKAISPKAAMRKVCRDRLRHGDGFSVICAFLTGSPVEWADDFIVSAKTYLKLKAIK